MADIHVPDVRDIYFQHKTLTHVIRQPHFGSLLVLSEELTANASSVTSTLCGGMYRHLDLLLTTQQFATKSE